MGLATNPHRRHHRAAVLRHWVLAPGKGRQRLVETIAADLRLHPQRLLRSGSAAKAPVAADDPVPAVGALGLPAAVSVARLRGRWRWPARSVAAVPPEEGIAKPWLCLAAVLGWRQRSVLALTRHGAADTAVAASLAHRGALGRFLQDGENSAAGAWGRHGAVVVLGGGDGRPKNPLGRIALRPVVR